jgi:16S rRNA (cytosine1402-N4)-methyltransferase
VHVSVLPGEVLEWLAPGPGAVFVDATLGGGGHSEALLERTGPDGRVVGLDADPQAIERARKRLARFGDRFEAVHARFSRLRAVAEACGVGPVDGVLMDLGVSSDQIDEPGRGFSFREEGPLDMRMNPDEPVCAADLVASLGERELADLLWRLGEEPHSRRIARRIVQAREQAPLRTTRALADVVAAARGGRSRPGLHPATQTFQALRMAVNREMDELAAGLEQGLALLRPGGRMVVIAFHSLEDRAVKTCFREHEGRRESLPAGGERVIRSEPPVRVLTRRPVRPGDEECARNSRARSARLRAAERSL